MSSLNPQESSKEQSRTASSYFALGLYEVENYDGGNRVEVRPVNSRIQDTGSQQRGKETIPALVPNVGDAHAYGDGQKLLVGFDNNETAYVVGAYDDPDDVSSSGDERVIGNHASDAEIRIKGDGTVVINADTVEIGGTGGSPVARKGDSVEVDDPDSGTITGTITGGSGNVNAE